MPTVCLLLCSYHATVGTPSQWPCQIDSHVFAVDMLLGVQISSKAGELEKRRQDAIVESDKLTKELGAGRNTWEEALTNERRNEAARVEKQAAITAVNVAKAVEKCSSKPASAEVAAEAASVATVMGNAVAEQATFN